MMLDRKIINIKKKLKSRNPSISDLLLELVEVIDELNYKLENIEDEVKELKENVQG